MPVKDLSQSLGVLFSDRRDFYLPDSMTQELWTNVAPFTTFTSKMGYDSHSDPDFKMFEHRAGFIKQTLAVDYSVPVTWTVDGTPGDTITIPIDIATSNGLGDSIGDQILDMLFEVYDENDVYRGVIRSQSRSGADVTFVSQGDVTNGPGYAVQDIDAAGFTLECIGTAIGEGETSPEAFADELEVVWNSCQIMRTPVEVTGTLKEAALRGYSKELERLRVQKAFEHKMQKEHTFLKGIRVGGTGMDSGDNFATIQNNAAGRKVRQTMGVISSLRKYGVSTATADNQNLFTLTSGTDGYKYMVDASEKISQYLPTRGRFNGFASRKWISWFSTSFLSNTAANEGITIYNNEKSEFGYKVMRVVTPHCEIDIAATPGLRRRYADTMVICNPDAIGLMKYRDMKYTTNIKTENGYDGVKDEYFSDEGIRLQMIETHSLWTLA